AAYVYQNDMIDGASISQQVIDLFAIAYSMIVIKGHVLGQAAAYGPNGKVGVNGLTLHAVAAQIALHSRHTRADLKYVEDMRNTIDMEKAPNAHAYNLLSSLERAMESVIQLREYADSRLSPAESILDRLGVSLSVFGPNLADVNDEVAAELTAMRRYGVKPAFFRDGLMHGPKEAWAIMPPPIHVNPVLAITSLSPLSDLADLECESRQLPDGTNA